MAPAVRKEADGSTTAPGDCRDGSASDHRAVNDVRAGVLALWLLALYRVCDDTDCLAGRQDDAEAGLPRRSLVRLRQAAAVHLIRLCARRVLRITDSRHRGVVQ